MTDRQHSSRATLVRRAAITMVVGLLLAASCGTGNEESLATTTSTMLPASTTTTTSAPGTTSTTVPPATSSTTVVSTGEPPVIELEGFTTVYSQDGQVRVNGWLDQPGELKVGNTSVEVRDDPYLGISTFDTVLDLDPGEYGIPITATGSGGLENEVYLTVLVDPALEMQLALIEEVDLIDRTLVADYVELFHGDEATIAAREDGEIGEDEETPGGFYLRNRNPMLRTLTLGDLEFVTVLACFEEKGPHTAGRAVPIDTWIELLDRPDMAEEELGWIWYGSGFEHYWLTLQDGMVVQIVEQYLP